MSIDTSLSASKSTEHLHQKHVFEAFCESESSVSKSIGGNQELMKFAGNSGGTDDNGGMCDVESNWEHEDLARVKVRVMRSHTDGVNSCQFFADDSKILTASTDKSIKIWNFDSGTVIQDFQNVHTDKINLARASHQAKYIASVGWDGRLRVTDITTGANTMVGDHIGVVMACAISYNDNFILSGSDLDHVVRLWDVRVGHCVRSISELHQSTITHCVFTPDDNRIVSSSMDCSTKLWDLRSNKITLTLKDHTNVVSCSSVSSDGHCCATASWDKTIKIWDIHTGVFRSQGPRTLSQSHDGSVSSCQFSFDNCRLVTGGYDKNVVVWDVKNEVEELKLQGHSDWVEDVDISKNGKWVLSGSRDRTTRLWNLEGMEGLPLVLENKRAIGLQIVHCMTCQKPFPLAQLESPYSDSVCVFCRLKQTRSSISVTSLMP